MLQWLVCPADLPRTGAGDVPGPTLRSPLHLMLFCPAMNKYRTRDPCFMPIANTSRRCHLRTATFAVSETSSYALQPRIHTHQISLEHSISC
jgi:hypothetical protein